jgi:hypothetical protein
MHRRGRATTEAQDAVSPTLFDQGLAHRADVAAPPGGVHAAIVSPILHADAHCAANCCNRWPGAQPAIRAPAGRTS